MHILKNIRDINIILFSDIMESKDATLLIQGECQDKEAHRVECDVVWSKLFDEYFKLKDDSRASNTISKNQDMTKQRAKLILSQHSLEYLVSLYKLNDIKEVARLKHEIVENLKSCSREFSRLNSLQDLKTTIEKITAIHEIMYRKYEMNNTRVEQVQEKESNNIERALVDIQNVLGYHIGDFKTISVPYYIELERSAHNKIKQLKNNGRK